MAEPDRDLLLGLLNEMEHELKVLALWESQPPPVDAFESELPFCADRMDFHQWLQWVFLARFRALIAGGHGLPGSCDIHPMAEEAMDHSSGRTGRLLDLLQDFDRQFP